MARALDKVQDRLHRLRPGQDRAWLEYKVSVLQLAIDKHGSCCVSLDLLQGPNSAGQSNAGQMDQSGPAEEEVNQKSTRTAAAS